jgi:antitoxin (DNA-binding transcriptional repressor) of toxin-antitoxin stability system
MEQFDVEDSTLCLDELVRLAAAGEDVVLARDGVAVARVLAVPGPSNLTAVRGAWRGRVEFADGVDDLPPDIAERFGAG